VIRPRDLLRRSVAVPNEHGAWALYLGPLLIGIAAGGKPTLVTLYLVVAASAGFLLRQPVTVLAKVRAGRRPAREAPAARAWIAVYVVVVTLHVGGIVLRGYGDILYLALPGVPVAAWYVALVMRRAQRKQPWVEVLAAGALSLSAPAAMWIGLGRQDPHGWILWALVWGGFAVAVLHTHLRLAQRTWAEPGSRSARLRAARAPLLLSAGCLGAVAALAALGAVSPLLLVPFVLQALEITWGARHPALGLRPREIGIRQLVVSVLFTLTFALAWHA
jgi:hypothetical protein